MNMNGDSLGNGDRPGDCDTPRIHVASLHDIALPQTM